MSQWKKHQSISRHLYALVWEDKICYIGQTVDLKRRAKEHQNDDAWNCFGPFVMYELGVKQGTRLEIEEWEYAWRMKAQWKGYRIVGGSDIGGPYFVNPSKRSTASRIVKAHTCKWPIKQRSWWKIALFGLLIVSAFHYI